MKREIAPKIIKINQQSYDKIAGLFSQTRQYNWTIFKSFLKYLQDGQNVLDVGCGNGRLVELLQNKDIDYTGIDNSQVMIKTAIKEHGQTSKQKFLHFDSFDKFEFAENSFDLVLAIAMFNHIPSVKLQKEFLQKIKKVLKPGGYLIMTNWNLWAINKKKNVFRLWGQRLAMSKDIWMAKYGFSKKEFGFKDVFTKWKSGKIEADLYYYAFTKKDLIKLSKAVGFEIEKNYYEANGQPTSWYKAQNLVTIVRKQ